MLLLRGRTAGYTVDDAQQFVTLSVNYYCPPIPN
jgi:hypothetical protein